jgi:AcrR family transcriptional regulator
MTKRLDPTVRRAEILDAALRMSRLHGYREATRNDIAVAARCSEALVSSYWGTMIQLRRAVVRRAIEIGDLGLIAQAIVANDPHVSKAPRDLREAAVASLL